MTDLPALREAVAKLTPGCPGAVWREATSRVGTNDLPDRHAVFSDWRASLSQHDWETLALLVNAAPALLDELERLRGLCHDGTHMCVCNAIASVDERWRQAESNLAAARAVLDSNEAWREAPEDRRVWLDVDRAAWQAWREGQQ